MPSIPLKLLDQKAEGYDCELWQDLDALYRGGHAFRERITRFLIQNPVEPASVYETLKAESSYRSFVGPIIDYYTAWLFSGSFRVRAKKAGTSEPIENIDPWYAEFREDCGGDTDLVDLLKDRFKTALVKQRSHVIAELPLSDPPPASKADFIERGLGDATLRAVDPEDLYDWECDEQEVLLWCSVHSIKKKRQSVAAERKTVTETWRVYDRELVTTYEAVYPDGERPRDEDLIREVDKRAHGFLQVPLFTIAIPEGLWLANRLRDPQVEHFRLGTALSWGIKRTCYAMPVFKVEDAQKPPVLGAGYFVMIGVTEGFEWSAPPSDHLIPIAKEIDTLRNDMFKIAAQGAAGLDNNAETVGRSADSKEQDIAATRIMLNAYGAIMTEAIEEIFEVISDARGDKGTTWSIEGFSGYDTATAPSLIANATNAQLLNIPSKTFLTEIKTKAALVLVPEASQDVKNRIRTEIAAGVETTADYLELVSVQPMQNGGKDEAQKPPAGMGGSGA